MERFVQAMWDGFRLTCPNCRRGPMVSRRRMHDACPACGHVFFVTGDGDWLVTWIVAYTVGAGLLLVLFPIIHFTFGLDLLTEIIVACIVGGIGVVWLFPNCKGVAAGLLLFLRRWTV